MYAAENETLTDSRPGYVYALRSAIAVMEAASTPVEAVALLRDQGSGTDKHGESFRAGPGSGRVAMEEVSLFHWLVLVLAVAVVLAIFVVERRQRRDR